MESNDAVVQLNNLVQQPGMLRIITSEPTQETAIALDGGGAPDLRSPRAYVIHDVVSLEGPDDEGIMIAHTAEGDWCAGTPEALLNRLSYHMNSPIR